MPRFRACAAVVRSFAKRRGGHALKEAGRGGFPSGCPVRSRPRRGEGWGRDRPKGRKTRNTRRGRAVAPGCRRDGGRDAGHGTMDEDGGREPTRTRDGTRGKGRDGWTRDGRKPAFAPARLPNARQRREVIAPASPSPLPAQRLRPPRCRRVSDGARPARQAKAKTEGARRGATGCAAGVAGGGNGCSGSTCEPLRRSSSMVRVSGEPLAGPESRTKQARKP